MPLPGICREIVVDVTAPGGATWEVEVSADGVAGISAKGLMQIFGFLPYEGIDVGIDRRSPVSWELYERHGAFAYTGHINHVRYQPGAFAPDAEDIRIDELRRIGLALE